MHPPWEFFCKYRSGGDGLTADFDITISPWSNRDSSYFSSPRSPLKTAAAAAPAWR
jgi:hypothetical protein